MGKWNILKEKQNKTKTKTRKPQPLVWLKNKTITHLRGWKTKQNKTKQIKKQKKKKKNRPNSPAPWNQNNDVRLSLRVGIMIDTFFPK